MTMTLGRAAIDDDPDGSSLRFRGDEVSFEFNLGASSVAEYQAITQQLRGMANNADETVFPFTWSEDPTLDGYYKNVQVDVEPSPVALTTGTAIAKVRMERVEGGAARPRLEVTTTSVVRTNSHSIVAPSPLLLFAPGGTIDFDPSEYTVTAFGTLDVAAPEDLTAYEASSTLGSKSYRLGVPAGSHYSAAATIEADYGGTFYPLVGQHAPADFNEANWRIGNGIVRLSPSWSASDKTYKLLVESWNGTAWAGTEFLAVDGVAAGVYPLFGSSLSGPLTYAAARIVRNSPETCIIRFDFSTLVTFVTVSRGVPFVVVHVTTVGQNTNMGWNVTAPGAPAATTFTGGARASANDSNGRRWLISCPSALSGGTAPYVTSATTSSTWQLCPDYQLEITANNGLTMRNYFMAATSFRQQVVAR